MLLCFYQSRFFLVKIFGLFGGTSYSTTISKPEEFIRQDASKVRIDFSPRRPPPPSETGKTPIFLNYDNWPFLRSTKFW